MADLLNLPGMQVRSHQQDEQTYHIEAEGLVEPTACPTCGGRLYKHGTKRQAFMDMPIHGKRVLIEMNRKRYRCKACGKTLLEPLPDIDPKRQATDRLVRFIEQHSLKKTFAEISREVGVDHKTVRNIFDDYVQQLGKTVHFETPEHLGIDELKIIGQYRAMITNVTALSLYDMLQTRNKADLIAYFRQMPDKHKVKIVTMDMWSVYRQVAIDQFPGRDIVADRFHVVRMANNAIEAIRRAVRKGLTTRERLKLKDDRFVLLARKGNLSATQLQTLENWVDQFPLLGVAFETKERFFSLYEHKNRRDAERAGEEWLDGLDPQIEWAFRETAGALQSWWTEIFNHYDHPISNAYTESINNIAKQKNRMGRGYSFEVIRAKLLYDKKAREVNTTILRPRSRKRSTKDDLTEHFMTTQEILESADQKPRVIEYGPHLPTLAKLLEEGYFE